MKIVSPAENSTLGKVMPRVLLDPCSSWPLAFPAINLRIGRNHPQALLPALWKKVVTATGCWRELDPCCFLVGDTSACLPEAGRT